MTAKDLLFFWFKCLERKLRIEMKEQLIQNINKVLYNRVSEYFKENTTLVFGDGDVNSKIMLIGEAPGKNEVEQGRPFVGQAGKNLQEFIEILDIERKDLYISNVVKFRPYKINPQTGRISNRPPTKEEIKLCIEQLFEEVKTVNPKIIITLGNVPLKAIIEKDSVTIGSMHGQSTEKSFDGQNYVVFPLYHPASIIYRRELRDIYLEDLAKLKNYLHQNKVLR